jgi:hypothetical protein
MTEAKPYPTFWKAVALIILGAVLQLIAGLFFSFLKLRYLLVEIIFVSTIAWLPVILIGFRFMKAEFKDVFRFSFTFFRVFSVIIMTFGFNILLSQLTTAIDMYTALDVSEGFEETYTTIFQEIKSMPLLGLVAIVVVPAFFEEMVFRGILLYGFAKNYKYWIAIILSSFLFAILHFEWLQSISAFFAGIYLGWVYLKSRSLLMPMVAHGMNNLISILPVFIVGNIFSDEALMSDTEPVLMGYRLIIFFAACFLIGFMMFRSSLKSDEDVF